MGGMYININIKQKKSYAVIWKMHRIFRIITRAAGYSNLFCHIRITYSHGGSLIREGGLLGTRGRSYRGDPLYIYKKKSKKIACYLCQILVTDVSQLAKSL